MDYDVKEAYTPDKGEVAPTFGSKFGIGLRCEGHL